MAEVVPHIGRPSIDRGILGAGGAVVFGASTYDPAIPFLRPPLLLIIP